MEFIIFFVDKESKASLEILQRSICVICIDNKLPESAPGEEDSTAAKMMLHGGGSQFNSANRWFDKTLQVCPKSSQVFYEIFPFFGKWNEFYFRVNIFCWFLCPIVYCRAKWRLWVKLWTHHSRGATHYIHCGSCSGLLVSDSDVQKYVYHYCTHHYCTHSYYCIILNCWT